MALDPSGRVYLIMKPSHKSDGSYPDLSPLEQHGSLCHLVDEHIKPSRDPELAFSMIEERLSQFDYRFDKIAWAGGDTLAAVLAGVCLADLEIPWFTFLRYDRNWDPKKRRRYQGGFYTPVKIQLENTVPDPDQLDLGIEEGQPDEHQ